MDKLKNFESISFIHPVNYFAHFYDLCTKENGIEEREYSILPVMSELSIMR